MNVIVLMAVGRPEWAEMVLNMALSIKANSPKQKIALIHQSTTTEYIESLLPMFFDYSYAIQNNPFTTSYELAFYTKTQLYDITTIMCPSATEFLYLDSDCIMLPGQNPSQWFDDHKERNFTTYCNGEHNFETKTTSRPDYTFWCEPQAAKHYWKIDGNRMPQINSSFIYFRPCESVKQLFDKTKEVWDDKDFPYDDYKNVKPDELCFNIASAYTGLLPHQSTYRPIFFRFASENSGEEFVSQNYRAMGFAGKTYFQTDLIDWYNRLTVHYRKHFGIRKKFEFSRETKAAKDDNPIQIKPFRRRTLFRAEEVEESTGGIFNPSGLMLSDGTRLTIFRKEKNLDAYKKYTHSTAIPHLHILSASEEKSCDLILQELPKDVRIEDFRLLLENNTVYCSHSLIKNSLSDDMTAQTGLSVIESGVMVYCGIPKLPIQTKSLEKNWVFFTEMDKDGILSWFCVYSLNPYRIFYTTENIIEGWREYKTDKPKFNWFHHGQFICNSTNPILVDDHYLMFFHTKEGGIYYHGAVLINKDTKQIEYYTRISITFPARNDGMHKNLHYISGAMYLPKENAIRVFAGENDSHSIANDYNKDELIAVIKRNKV